MKYLDYESFSKERKRLESLERNGLYDGGYHMTLNGGIPTLSNKHDVLLTFMVLAKKHKEEDLIQVVKDAYKINQLLAQGQLP